MLCLKLNPTDSHYPFANEIMLPCLLPQLMEFGQHGVPTPTVPQTVDMELRLDTDTVTIQHLLMAELTVQEIAVARYTV